MRAKAVAAALAFTAIAWAMLPGGAEGATRTEKFPASVTLAASFRGSNGFSFQATVDEGIGTVSAIKRSGRFSAQAVSFAVVHAHSGEDGSIDMKIGNQGRFQGRFIARSTSHEAPLKGCTAEATTIEKGFYLGSFVFHGKGGFSHVDRRRVAGNITRQPALVCREKVPTHKQKQHGHAESGSKEFQLSAIDKARGIEFHASRSVEPSAEEERLGGAFYYADAQKFSKGVLMTSMAICFLAKPTTLAYPAPHTEATVMPPAPFSGSATYVSNGGKKGIWTGDLSVELPGFGRVPLTGKKFTATAEEGPAENSGSFYGGEVQTIS